MKVADIRNMSDEELRKQLADLRKELVNLRFQLATKKLTNSNRLTAVKREIARVQTVLRERELAPAQGGF